MSELTPEQRRKLEKMIQETVVWDGGDAGEIINLRQQVADLQAQLDAANQRAGKAEAELAVKDFTLNSIGKRIADLEATSDHEHALHLAAMERNRKLQDEFEIAKHETQAALEVVRQLRNVKNGDAVMYSSISASAMQEASRQLKQLRDENQQLRARLAELHELGIMK